MSRLSSDRRNRTRGKTMLKEQDKRILIELVCNEQTNMIMSDCMSYTSEKYRELEKLKIKLKNRNTTKDTDQ